MIPQILPGALVPFLMCFLLTACGETITSIPVELEDHFLELPNGNVMHYYEEGNPQGKTLLMVHGYPASAYLYRYLIQDLCGAQDTAYRCIAMTHIGFGKSSCPGDGAMVSPLYEVDQLEQFIQAMQLDQFAIIVHDWGGPIGTAASLRVSEKMTHMVLLNTVLSMPESGILHWASIVTGDYFSQPRPILESLYPTLIRGLMQWLTNVRLSERDLAVYTGPFEGDSGGCRVHATANLFSKMKADEALFSEIEAGLRTSWAGKPALFIWAPEDPVLGQDSELGEASFRTVQALLPAATTYLVEEASHFLQEDQPREISREIHRFLSN